MFSYFMYTILTFDELTLLPTFPAGQTLPLGVGSAISRLTAGLRYTGTCNNNRASESASKAPNNASQHGNHDHQVKM